MSYLVSINNQNLTQKDYTNSTHTKRNSLICCCLATGTLSTAFTALAILSFFGPIGSTGFYSSLLPSSFVTILTLNVLVATVLIACKKRKEIEQAKQDEAESKPRVEVGPPKRFDDEKKVAKPPPACSPEDNVKTPAVIRFQQQFKYFHSLPPELIIYCLIQADVQTIAAFAQSSSQNKVFAEAAIIEKARQFGCPKERIDLNKARLHLTDLFNELHFVPQDAALVQRYGGHAEIFLSHLPEATDEEIISLFIFRTQPIQSSQKLAAYCLKIHEEKGFFKTKGNLPSTALIEAAECKNFMAVRLFVELGLDINTSNDKGQTVLHLAAKNEADIDLLNFLLKKGADVNAVATMMIPTEIQGCTPFMSLLFYSASSKDVNEVKALLLAQNETIEGAEDVEEDTSLHLLSNKWQSVITRLKLQQAHLLKGDELLAKISEAIKYEEVKLLLSYNPDITKAASNGWTALHIAAHRNWPSVVALLLEKVKNLQPANLSPFLDARGARQETAFLCAHFNRKPGDQNRCLATLEVLFENGANPSLPYFNGSAAIHFAAQEGLDEVVERLVKDPRVNIHAVGGDNLTPLQWALANENNRIRYDTTKEEIFRIIRLLTFLGRDVNAPEASGDTLLHYAVFYRCEKSIKFLIENHADVHQVDSKGHTAVQKLFFDGSKIEDEVLVILNLLVENGADVHGTDKDGKSLLHHAAYFGWHAIILRLLELGLDIEKRDAQGQTPLISAMLAYRKGTSQSEIITTITLFLQSNAESIKICDNNLRYPIHYAAQHGLDDVITFLARTSINELKAQDKDKKTPYDLAYENMQRMTAGLLRGLEASLSC
jgi:ankyrin repeat protein